jgi:hypothetical protein
MNYCPTCGEKLKSGNTEQDVGTEHNIYVCPNGHMWEETTLTDGELLHICPVEKE